MGNRGSVERRYGETIPLKVLRVLFLREAASYPGGANKTQTQTQPQAQAQTQKGGAKESAAEEVKESKDHAE